MKSDLRQTILDVIVSSIFTVLVVLLLNPMDIIMADEAKMFILGLVVFLVIAFMVFLWRQNPTDERDSFHHNIASKISFYTIAAVLLVALIFQASKQDIDPWIGLSLIVLILSKVATLIYLRVKG